MMFSQGRLLRLVAPYLAPVLIAPGDLAAIGRFADGLPDAFTWGILELRLVAGDPRADLEICAGSRDGSRVALAEAFAARAATGAAGPLAPLEPLLRAWAAGQGRLADMPQLFLEYDDPARGTQPPFVFLATDHDARCCPRPPERGTDDVIALAREGLALARGALDPVPFATWERCLRALPPGGRALTMAPLDARGLRALRLDASLPRAAIGPWLDAIGWPGDRAQLARLFALIGPGWARHRLQLDLGASVGPRLGVLYRPPVGAHDPASWRPILEQLGALGACAPAKAAAALSWIGTERIDLADLGWPISVQRDLDLKLTLTGDATLEAKSYFSYHAGWAALAAPSLTRSSSDAARPAS